MTTPDYLACPTCGRQTDFRVYLDGRIQCADDDCRAIVARLLPSTIDAWQRRRVTSMGQSLHRQQLPEGGQAHNDTTGTGEVNQSQQGQQ